VSMISGSVLAKGMCDVFDAQLRGQLRWYMVFVEPQQNISREHRCFVEKTYSENVCAYLKYSEDSRFVRAFRRIIISRIIQSLKDKTAVTSPYTPGYRLVPDVHVKELTQEQFEQELSEREEFIIITQKA
jgi:hypothetical protein